MVWPGHFRDAETGLHYNRHRYYSPELGRYLQSDPAGISGGVNLYAYTPRPLSEVDVWGMGCGDESGKPPKDDQEGTQKAAQETKPPLKFGENDLVYGPSARGALRRLQEGAGGKLLTDLGEPGSQGWTKFSLGMLDDAAQSGRPVHFDLTHMQDMDGVLAGTGKQADRVTSQEIRHIRDNWDSFKEKPKFYRDGEEVPPPWTK
jgi:RHS repeat-associated protein